MEDMHIKMVVADSEFLKKLHIFLEKPLPKVSLV